LQNEFSLLKSVKADHKLIEKVKFNLFNLKSSIKKYRFLLN